MSDLTLDQEPCKVSPARYVSAGRARQATQKAVLWVGVGDLVGLRAAADGARIAARLSYVRLSCTAVYQFGALREVGIRTAAIPDVSDESGPTRRYKQACELEGLKWALPGVVKEF